MTDKILAFLLGTALVLLLPAPLRASETALPPASTGASPTPEVPLPTVAAVAPAPVAQPATLPIPASAATDASNAAASLPAEMRALDDKQRLSPGDRVSFRVKEDREDPKPFIVTDSGELDLPYIGRIKASDKTCLQIASELKVLLEKDYYHRATVIMGVDALSRTRGKVYLYGQIRAPQPIDIPVDEVLTVSKAVLRAGGFSDFANKRKVTVTRKGTPETGGNLVYEIDLIEVLERGRTERDLQLQADDTIFVPQRLVNF